MLNSMTRVEFHYQATGVQSLKNNQINTSNFFLHKYMYITGFKTKYTRIKKTSSLHLFVVVLSVARLPVRAHKPPKTKTKISSEMNKNKIRARC